jgi:hypothetical protein
VDAILRETLEWALTHLPWWQAIILALAAGFVYALGKRYRPPEIPPDLVEHPPAPPIVLDQPPTDPSDGPAPGVVLNQKPPESYL